MIQRKQSIYLLLVTVLMSFLLIRPYAELTLKDGKEVTFYSQKIIKHSTGTEDETYRRTIPLVLLVILTGAISFINIFYYNRRLLQIRICIVIFILLSVIILIMGYYYMHTRGDVQTIKHVLRMAGVFPIIAIIMNFLAYRAINADEMLVNSYNRIR